MFLWHKTESNEGKRSAPDFQLHTFEWHQISARQGNQAFQTQSFKENSVLLKPHWQIEDFRRRVRKKIQETSAISVWLKLHKKGDTSMSTKKRVRNPLLTSYIRL